MRRHSPGTCLWPVSSTVCTWSCHPCHMEHSTLSTQVTLVKMIWPSTTSRIAWCADWLEFRTFLWHFRQRTGLVFCLESESKCLLEPSDTILLQRLLKYSLWLTVSPNLTKRRSGPLSSMVLKLACHFLTLDLKEPLENYKIILT